MADLRSHPYAWRAAGLARSARARVQARSFQVEPMELVSTAGYRLNARRVRAPGASGPLPGLVVSPAIHQGLHALLGGVSVVNAYELAQLGYTVLVYDPAGLGESWGEDDLGGPEQQDNLRCAVRTLAAHPSCNGRVGVLSLSFGISAAVGALVGASLPVEWLVDWEGPCDREILTAGGTRLAPAGGHSLTDETWWGPREALTRIASLPCGYVRLQAFPDHAQPEELRHARRMLWAAKHGTVPWWQLNEEPRGTLHDRPVWLPGGPMAANSAILRKLRALHPG